MESVCLTLVHRGVEAARGSAGEGDDDVWARVRVREVVCVCVGGFAGKKQASKQAMMDDG